MNSNKKRVPSQFNGLLEIEWRDGKKRLNTKNANYSYGALQVVLKFALEKIDLKKVNSILLLGLGGGSVIQTLREDFKYQKSITAVDIDPVIIDIALTEFQLEEDANLKITCDDALEYMRHHQTTYDLIIIDLFIDIHVPKAFLELDFWKSVLRSKSSNGMIIFNASLETSVSEPLKTVIEFLKSKVYKVDVFDKVNNTNTVVISQSL